MRYIEGEVCCSNGWIGTPWHIHREDGVEFVDGVRGDYCVAAYTDGREVNYDETVMVLVDDRDRPIACFLAGTEPSLDGLEDA